MLNLFRLALLTALTCSTLSAELFFQPGVSASALGTAFASAPASAEDITLQFYNPAVSGYHYGKNIAFVPKVFFPFSSFEQGAAQNAEGDAISGSNHQNDVSNYRLGGAIFATCEGNNWLHFHFGATTPWQMDNGYKHDWAGRYYGTRATIESVNLAPGLSIRFNNMVIGASAQIDYMYHKMSRAIDFGQIAFDNGIAGALPSQQDGYETLSGHDWAYGWCVGGLIEMCWYMRLGAGYRSGIKHTLVTMPQYNYGVIGEDVAAVTGSYQPVCAQWQVHTPEVAWGGFQYLWSDEVLMFFSMSWRNWGKMKQLVVEYQSINQPDEVTDLGWHETLSFALGFIYDCNCDWTWRFGAEYIQSPSDDPHPLYFANEQIKVGAGVGYWLYRGLWRVDIGYTHAFMRDMTVYRSVNASENAYRGSLTGVIYPSENELAFQLVGIF